MWKFILSLSLLVVAQASNSSWTTKGPQGEDLFFHGSLDEKPVEEGFCDNTKQLSGYFKIDGSKSKNYFYWFFESKSKPENDPLIIWLTGGPGCSSMLALLVENGPCMLNDDLSLKTNPFSWNTRANVMWIDQPAGVGFSYGDVSEYDTSEKMVGDDMFHFLQSFFKAHPEYQKQAFYVFGESYAGHYVPAVAHRIYTGNKNKEGLHINLQGLGIGNGLTDPEHQYPMYPEMAFNNQYKIKAISEATYKVMKAASPKCVKMIQACQSFKPACLAAEMFCNEALVAPYQLSGLNVYDIREKCEHFPMCYDFSHVEKFFNMPDVREKLHVTEKSGKWESCNMKVHAGFTFDWMKNFQKLVPPMLEDGIRTLVYAGDADFIVNWMGCKAWTLNLDWKHKDEFVNQEDKDWVLKDSNKAGGKVRSVNGFTFLQVYEAGHMVPMNQPANSLDMLDRFLSNSKFTAEEHDSSKDKTQDWFEMLKDITGDQTDLPAIVEEAAAIM